MEEQPKKIKVAQIMGKMVSGGVEAMVMNYTKNMDPTRFQTDFIVDSDSIYIPREEIEKMKGRIVEVPPYQRIMEYIKTLTKILKENNYDIVVSNLNTLSIFPLFCAKRAKIPVRVAYSHSTSNKKEQVRNLMKQVLKRFSKLYPTHYFCCSQYAGRWLFGNRLYDDGKVELINNAVEVDRFIYCEETRKQKRKELEIEDKFVIGHVGRFVEQKNHIFLIDIFQKIHEKNPNAVLLLAGDGPLVETVMKKVKELKLQDAVKFLGVRKDVNELMQAMDVFLLPSLYEGLPVVGVEAQASGLLCALSENMTKETKVLEDTFFVSLEETPEKWADLIIEYYQNHKRENTKQQLIDKNFDIQCEAKKLEQIYLRIAKEK